MGKTKKSNMKTEKNVPLDRQILESKVVKSKNRNKIKLRSEETSIIDSKTSEKILNVARRQKRELERGDCDEEFPALLPPSSSKRSNFNLGNDEDDDDDVGVAGCGGREFSSKQDDYYFEDLPMNDEDLEAFERFQQKNEGKRTLNLSEVIMSKIKEKQSDLHAKFSDVGSLQIEELDPKVKEMYEGVRDVMKKYRSGKVPKAFKIIPRLRNWEQILYVTEPHNWSAAAMFQGTRIFSAILSQAMAQRFYNLVLLPRIRDDLCEYKKLNMYLYNALKRALFKPAAFMKGIILPLLESGDCTLREALIFGSVISRTSVPILHSCACLLKICEMGYTGANSIFIRCFLEKAYALPYRVVDAAVFHFLRFEQDKRAMPVLWHQSLLTFAQRYKNDISSEQKEALINLLRKQNHPKITPEIRKELLAAKCRDVELMECTMEQSENHHLSDEMLTDNDLPLEEDL